jgi:Domain of unknown function (DUF222)/HNH endonuclease
VKDLRPASNRRAHALVEALRHTLDLGTLPSQGGEKPHLTITMRLEDLEDLRGKASLDDGTPLSAAKTRMLLCDARIIPAVLGAHSEILDIGRAARTFPTNIRRAITLRDQGCVWPGCDRPPSWTDAHHIEPWSRGGETSLNNGVLMCPRHHADIHRGEWTVRLGHDGRAELIPPKWMDQQQRARRNTLHHHEPMRV